MRGAFTAFLLAAPSSGSGKTTLTLGLLRLLSKRGFAVQPFKCGPDYLDTRLHGMAASIGGQERVGMNLDPFMASQDHARALFARSSADADIAVVEGVMGLFDGAEKSRGSSAEVARLLGIPVIMVVDARSMAYSAAPLLYGFKNFDPSLRVQGVIFNRVRTASHYRYLMEAAHDAGVEPLGYLPPNDGIAISERHLGLNTSAGYDREAVIEAMAAHLEPTIAVDRLLEVARIPRPEPPLVVAEAKGRMVIAVARDEAFNFLYRENLAVLEEYGRIEWFSPMTDSRIPEADLLYLAGGYPELYARELSRNEAMRSAIAAYCHGGGRAYAECGGLMYLARAITLADGTRYPMCGVFEFDTTMQDARLRLGYRTIRMLDEGNAGKPYGGELRGHEFHYSRLAGMGAAENIAEVRNARGEACSTGVYRQGSAIASYVHLYWGETRDFPGWLLGIH